MKLTIRAFHYDYYNEDLDLPLGRGKPNSNRSKAKQRLKRMAAKARRVEGRRIIQAEGLA